MDVQPGNRAKPGKAHCCQAGARPGPGGRCTPPGLRRMSARRPGNQGAYSPIQLLWSRERRRHEYERENPGPMFRTGITVRERWRETAMDRHSGTCDAGSAPYNDVRSCFHTVCHVPRPKNRSTKSPTCPWAGKVISLTGLPAAGKAGEWRKRGIMRPPAFNRGWVYSATGNPATGCARPPCAQALPRRW